MRYTLDNGKVVTISDKELEKNMKLLEISKEEAIDLWLEDNDYQVNEEQQELQEKARNYKPKLDARANKPKKASKPRTVNISDEKKALFNEIHTHLLEVYGESNIEVANENKLIYIQLNDKKFKLDLIQTRQKKNS